MKKILLLSLAISSFLVSNAQYPLTGSTLADGEKLVSGVNPGITGCNSNTGGPTSCPQICLGTNPATISFAGPGLWNVYFEYYNPTSGNKGIRIEILCGSTVLVDQCLDASANGNDKRYYKTYSSVPCTNLSTLLVRLTPYTGNSCGGSGCGASSTSVGGGQLPVDFKSFTAVRNRSNVLLKWETLTEKNNTGFAMERNTTGAWEQIAWIPTQAVGGNSDDILSYTYNDLNDAKGMTQYRIRQVDLDGRSKYSEVRSVRGEDQRGQITVYPNPSSDGKINIVFDGGNVVRDISVVDMNGRTVKQLKGVSGTNVSFENLVPGMYTVRVIIPSTGEQIVEKIVVNKL